MVALAQMSQRCFSYVFILEAQTLKHVSVTCGPTSTIFHAVQFYIIVILSFTLQQTELLCVLFFPIIFESSLLILYSTSICNRSLYSILLCKVMSFFRSVACSNILCILLNVHSQWMLKSMLCVLTITMLGSGFISTTISFQD